MVSNLRVADVVSFDVPFTRSARKWKKKGLHCMSNRERNEHTRAGLRI